MLTESSVEGNTIPPAHEKGGVLDMTQICIWWWGYSSKDLRSVEYTFIIITPRFTLTLSGSTC